MKIIMPDGGLGDELSITAVVREHRRREPQEKIALEGFKRMDIWEHNPNLHGGTSDSGRIALLDWSRFWDAGSLPRRFGMQLGLAMVNDSPEIFLSGEERAVDYKIPETRTVAIDAWARWPSRRWPHFQATVDLLRDDGWAVVEVGKHPGPNLRGALDFRDRFTIRQTAAILARCSIYLGNDSGLFHLAAAVGTPQVIVFGPVKWWTRSYFNTLPLRSEKGCDCPNAPETCKVGPVARCMTEISPAQALEAVTATWSRTRRS